MGDVLLTAAERDYLCYLLDRRISKARVDAMEMFDSNSEESIELQSKILTFLELAKKLHALCDEPKEVKDDSA